MKRLVKALAYSLVLTFFALVFVSMLWPQPHILTLICVALSGLLLWIRKDREELYLYIIIGLGGATTESIAIFFGAWHYGLPNIVGIPYWLPFLWGFAGLVTKRIMEEIHDFVRNPPHMMKN